MGARINSCATPPRRLTVAHVTDPEGPADLRWVFAWLGQPLDPLQSPLSAARSGADDSGSHSSEEASIHVKFTTTR